MVHITKGPLGGSSIPDHPTAAPA